MILPYIRRWIFLLIAPVVFIFSPVESATSLNQDAGLGAIRSLYAAIQKKIAVAVKEAEGGSPPGLYSTEVFINSHNGSWRAVGNYFKKTTFWYADQPQFAAAEGRPEHTVLLKVEIDESAGAGSVHKEFLFDQGRLVFVFVRVAGGSSAKPEQRYYFDGGMLFRYLEDQHKVDEMPDVSEIKAEAASHQTLFLATFKASDYPHVAPQHSK